MDSICIVCSKSSYCSKIINQNQLRRDALASLFWPYNEKSPLTIIVYEPPLLFFIHIKACHFCNKGYIIECTKILFGGNFREKTKILRIDYRYIPSVDHSRLYCSKCTSRGNNIEGGLDAGSRCGANAACGTKGVL